MKPTAAKRQPSNLAAENKRALLRTERDNASWDAEWAKVEAYLDEHKDWPPSSHATLGGFMERTAKAWKDDVRRGKIPQYQYLKLRARGYPPQNATRGIATGGSHMDRLLAAAEAKTLSDQDWRKLRTRYASGALSELTARKFTGFGYPIAAE